MRLVVSDGDKVKAGDRITEGSLDPHDIIRIKGDIAVQNYLIEEVQKHIEHKVFILTINI